MVAFCALLLSLAYLPQLRMATRQCRAGRAAMCDIGGWSTLDASSWVIDEVVEEEGPADMLARAWEEDAFLGGVTGLALSAASETTSDLADRGVARIGGVLSANAAAVLRVEVLRQLAGVRQAAGLDDGEAASRLSSVLSSVADPEREEATRWDLRLRLTRPVRSAVREALTQRALTDALVAAAGADAELWECAALISAPGAAPQPLHADTLWDQEGVLFSTFIALQDVTPAMGPTRFLVGSHTLEAHEAFDDDGIDYVSAAAGSAACGLLAPGEATLYDGRVLHCGGPNRSDELRILFYLTFRRRGADGEELANDEAHSIHQGYRGRFTLGTLLRRSE